MLPVTKLGWNLCLRLTIALNIFRLDSSDKLSLSIWVHALLLIWGLNIVESKRIVLLRNSSWELWGSWLLRDLTLWEIVRLLSTRPSWLLRSQSRRGAIIRINLLWCLGNLRHALVIIELWANHSIGLRIKSLLRVLCRIVPVLWHLHTILLSCKILLYVLWLRRVESNILRRNVWVAHLAKIRIQIWSHKTLRLVIHWLRKAHLRHHSYILRMLIIHVLHLLILKCNWNKWILWHIKSTLYSLWRWWHHHPMTIRVWVDCSKFKVATIASFGSLRASLREYWFFIDRIFTAFTIRSLRMIS